MISPASGFAATNATSSSRSESGIIGFTSFRNRAVSTTVIGASSMFYYYTQFAYCEQDGLQRRPAKVLSPAWTTVCGCKWRAQSSATRRSRTTPCKRSPTTHMIVDDGHVTLTGGVKHRHGEGNRGMRASSAGLSFGPVTNSPEVEHLAKKS
jgi:hypothetical protein